MLRSFIAFTNSRHRGLSADDTTAGDDSYMLINTAGSGAHDPPCPKRCLEKLTLKKSLKEEDY